MRVILGEVSIQKLVSLDPSSLKESRFSDPIEIPECRKLLRKNNEDKCGTSEGVEFDVAFAKRKTRTEEEPRNGLFLSLFFMRRKGF